MRFLPHEVWNQFGHDPSQDYSRDADHDEYCTFDDGDFAIVIPAINGQDEC